MKLISLLAVLALAVLTAGCSKTDDKPGSHPDRTTKTQLPTISGSADAGGVPPPPGQSIPAAGASADARAVPNASVALVRDAEKAVELADYSEKVFLQWNEALKRFRTKERRLPGSLAELQKFQPKLASFAPPKGFQLDLDPQLGEINVVRSALTGASR